MRARLSKERGVDAICDEGGEGQGIGNSQPFSQSGIKKKKKKQASQGAQEPKIFESKKREILAVGDRSEAEVSNSLKGSLERAPLGRGIFPQPNPRGNCREHCEDTAAATS